MPKILLEKYERIGRGSLETYSIFPGIYLNKCKAEHFYIEGDSIQMPFYYEVSFSCLGQCFNCFNDSEKECVEPGNLLIMRNYQNKFASSVSGIGYQGFNIIIIPEELQERQIQACREIFAFDLLSFLTHIDQGPSIFKYPCRMGLNRLGMEMIELLERGEITYLKIKFFEFLYLLHEGMVSEKDDIYQKYDRIQREKAKRVKNLIDSDLSKHRTIEDLSKTCDLAETSLKQIFKEIYDLPPYEYLTRARMIRAAELLIETKKTVMEIALDLGYNNPSNFTRSFRRMYGVTPNRYRKTAQSQ